MPLVTHKAIETAAPCLQAFSQPSNRLVISLLHPALGLGSQAPFKLCLCIGQGSNSTAYAMPQLTPPSSGSHHTQGTACNASLCSETTSNQCSTESSERHRPMKPKPSSPAAMQPYSKYKTKMHRMYTTPCLPQLQKLQEAGTYPSLHLLLPGAAPQELPCDST